MSSGTVEVLDNNIRLLVDEVDTRMTWLREAEAALKRAQDLKEKAGDAVSIAEAQAMMDRQAVRLQLVGLKKASKKHYSFNLLLQLTLNIRIRLQY